MAGLTVPGTGLSTVMPRATATYVGGLTASFGLPLTGNSGWLDPTSGLTLRGSGFTLGQGVTTSFNFLSDGALPSGATLTRASTGWYFNSSLVLTSALTDVARWTYSPTAGTLLGLLNEPVATDSVPNGSGTGSSATPTTPGTTPTGWSVSTTANNVTRTVGGPASTEDGIAYWDVRYAGTPSAGGSISIGTTASTLIDALTGQTWVSSFFVRLTAGSLANLATLNHNITERTAAGGSVAAGNIAIAPTSAALRTQRFDQVRTLSGGGTVAKITQAINITYTINNAVDFTFRIGVPQLVQEAAATSPIVTTAGAITRAADILTITLANGTYTIYITRASGLTTVSGVVVGAGTYVVPTDPSPIQSISAVRTA